MEVNAVTVRTQCIKCGIPIKVESRVYIGKEVLRPGLFKTGQFHLDDPYTIVHLLCTKCDMRQGFQKNIDDED